MLCCSNKVQVYVVSRRVHNAVGSRQSAALLTAAECESSQVMKRAYYPSSRAVVIVIAATISLYI